MHKIFRGAVITIAASDAATSTNGFLQTRTGARPTMLHAVDDTAASFKLIAVRADKGNERALYKRAWVLQEMHLSHRVLLFGNALTSFVCMEMERLDGGHASSASREGFMDPGSMQLAGRSHPNAWRQIVTIFSNLRLSVPVDKLPALGAMAEDYALRRKVGGYFAGLWKEDFEAQLLWRLREDRTTLPRCDDYCGPSWSWCSVVDDPIFYMHVPSVPPYVTYTVNVKDIHIELLSTLNPYGRVTSGRLVLIGNMRNIVWPDPAADLPETAEGEKAAGDQSSSYDPYPRPTIEPRPLLNVYFDRQEEWPDGSQLSIIEIARNKDSIFGLVLQAVRGSPQVYQRAGFMECDIFWFDNHTVTEMEIVVI